MVPERPSLAELQARLQKAIVEGDDAVLSLIPPNSRTSNAVLLGVYRFAYVGRLVEVVRNAHPLLARHMGEQAFEQMARDYVAKYPSRHANARWYALDVPELLAQRPYSEQPELAELARIEAALDRAFDAPDAPVLDLAELAQHPPETWGSLAFRPHPSASVLSCATNAFDLWLALKEEAEAPEVELLEEPQTLLAWRRNVTPAVRRLEAEERMLWLETTRGASFGALCEMSATFDDPGTAALRVAQYLQGWLASGLLSEVVT
jgi:hypothetical protein